MKTAQDYLSDYASGHLRGGFNSRLFDESRSSNIQGLHFGEVLAERDAGWMKADDMIMRGEIFSQIKTRDGHVEFKCYADGDSYCCVGEGFINLQDSDNYTFAGNWQEAINDFIRLTA